MIQIEDDETNRTKMFAGAVSIMEEVSLLNKQFTNLARLWVMDETSYENPHHVNSDLFDGVAFSHQNWFFDGEISTTSK